MNELKLASPNSSGTRFRQACNLLGPFFGLLLVLGLFSLSAEVRPYLFTGGNLKIILIQTVIVALGALGMTMIIISGGIDLSVGSVVALTPAPTTVLTCTPGGWWRGSCSPDAIPSSRQPRCTR